MTISLAQIERQAKTLAAEDRAKLAESLLDSLHTPFADIESAWTDEIESRITAYDRIETHQTRHDPRFPVFSRISSFQ